MKTILLMITVLVSCALPVSGRAESEALEVGPKKTHLLPGGKEADGIIGDFVLQNDRVQAVISGDLPHRKANMSTYWNEITPGCVFDLTLRGTDNDQLTIFSPCNQSGPVSYVRILETTDEQEVAVEAVSSAALNSGLYKRHEYRLREGWQGLRITTTFRNESQSKRRISLRDRWTTFTRTGETAGIYWADAVDPADKAGYAYARLQREGKPTENEIELEAGETIMVVRFLAVGRSPAEAVGVIASMREETGNWRGRVRDESGAGLGRARLVIPWEGSKIPAYPDEDGNLAFAWPTGEYEVRIEETGRPPIRRKVEIKKDQDTSLEATLGPASVVAFDIKNEKGESIPCKAQFIGVNGTKSPDLGPPNRAHGCRDQYHSERGKFRVAIPPGDYRVIVTRGIEFSHLEKEIGLKEGETVVMEGTLERLVDSRGWISADYHNHSTPSGDNTCGTDDRLINLAAEQVEFAPTTEHNRFYDWTPHIKKLGLSRFLSTIPGIELTGPGAHFNAFPFEPHPHTQDGGAPVWKKDPRLNAITLRNFQGQDSSRWLQINHPDMVENFIDRDGDGHADGGYLGLGKMIDGAETWGLNILARAPVYVTKNNRDEEQVRYRREIIWLQLLNQGHRYWCVAVSDAHSVHGNGVGGWRMYVRSSTDEPDQIQWQEISRNSKAGHSFVTSGPFLEVSTSQGAGPGDTVRALKGVELRVKVQCTDWIDIDRVQILVNGRQRPDLNFVRAKNPEMFGEGVVKFEQEIEVPLSEDSHLIVVAYGETHDLSKGYGSSRQASWNPCAYNNPIFVDLDGGGFTPNGDNLDWPLPTKKLDVPTVKARLSAMTE